MYTVVTMYKIDAQGKTLGVHQKIILEGSVDEIFTTKDQGMLPDRILVIAGAGRGKTTAIAKMAYDWAYRVQGSPFENLPLLFILRLRDVSPEASFGQAIIEQLLNDVPELTAQPLEKFMRSNQNLCWILLDGLDEFSGSMDPSAAVAGNIINVITNRELPSSRVLVTTRPHLEHEFERNELPRIYAKMYIEGFSYENAKHYIDKFFSNDKATGNKLQLYLSQHDVINELVSTPLFCLMVCYLWREHLLLGIDTQTQLFDNVNMFLWHHSKSRSPTYTSEWLARTLYQLGKVAFDGLLIDSNRLVFRTEDFKDVPHAMRDGCELGVVITYSYNVYDKIDQHITTNSIEFYHKLGQEHTAAKYLAHQTTHRRFWQKSKLDELMNSKRECISNYEHLLRFVCGTDSDLCERIMTGILSNTLLDDSERYRIILDCLSESPGLEGNISSMVQGCVNDGVVTLKSPTVYTVVGMRKLPDSLRNKV